MPFGPVFTPSIGLSLLQAELARADISSDIRYFSIRFAERVGSRLYTAISQSQGIPIVTLAGEWIFSRGLAELRHLAAAYPGSEVQVVDNILEMTRYHPIRPESFRADSKSCSGRSR